MPLKVAAAVRCSSAHSLRWVLTSNSIRFSESFALPLSLGTAEPLSYCAAMSLNVDGESDLNLIGLVWEMIEICV